MSVGGYNERLQIRRPTDALPPGTQDPDTGLVTDPDVETPDDDVLSDAPADVQDKPVVVTRDSSGAPLLTADAVAFLQFADDLKKFKLNDVVSIVWSDETVEDARVMRIQRFDISLFLVRV